MEKYYVGVAGLVLTVLLAMHAVSSALASLTAVCCIILLIRANKGPRNKYLLVVWGLFFAMVIILLWDYAYQAHLISTELYSTQRAIMSRAFLATGTLCAVLRCLIVEASGQSRGKRGDNE